MTERSLLLITCVLCFMVKFVMDFVVTPADNSSDEFNSSQHLNAGKYITVFVWQAECVMQMNTFCLSQV